MRSKKLYEPDTAVDHEGNRGYRQPTAEPVDHFFLGGHGATVDPPTPICQGIIR